MRDALREAVAVEQVDVGELHHVSLCTVPLWPGEPIQYAPGRSLCNIRACGGRQTEATGRALVDTAETPPRETERRSGASTPRRSRGLALDMLFALLAVSTIAYFVRETRNFSFRVDDWALAFRGGSFGDYFEPYNDHLAIVHIAIYKTFYEIWGFGTYLPLHAIAIGTIAAIAVAMYLLFERGSEPRDRHSSQGPLLLWYPQLHLTVPDFPLFLPVVGCDRLCMDPAEAKSDARRHARPRPHARAVHVRDGCLRSRRLPRLPRLHPPTPLALGRSHRPDRGVGTVVAHRDRAQ